MPTVSESKMQTCRVTLSLTESTLSLGLLKERATKQVVVWECQTPDGQTFRVRPRGTQEARRELFENGGDYVGQQLTVRYQELTDDGVPRFPVGIAIRDYE